MLSNLCIDNAYSAEKLPKKLFLLLIEKKEYSDKDKSDNSTKVLFFVYFFDCSFYCFNL